MVRPAASENEQQSARRQMGWVCQHCHAPRFVAEQQANGVQMAELGEMKLREAEDVVRIAQDEFPGEQTVRIEELLESMKKKTLKALSLGIAHQSPDYQWWHGHPALDGLLLRIKGELTHLRRSREEKTETDKS
jgi:hypothetical protein